MSSKILGIDPGFETAGWALVEKSAGGPRALAYGHIKTVPSHKTERRLLFIFRELDRLIKRHQPDCCAVEEAYLTKRTPTQLNTLQARGVIILACVSNNLPIFPYNPKTVKKAVSGNGSAGKLIVQKFVQARLRLKDIPRPDDAADALALALTHLQISGVDWAIRCCRGKIEGKARNKRKEFSEILKKARAAG